jgi:hypothetical protein
MARRAIPRGPKHAGLHRRDGEVAVLPGTGTTPHPVAPCATVRDPRPEEGYVCHLASSPGDADEQDHEGP